MGKTAESNTKVSNNKMSMRKKIFIGVGGVIAVAAITIAIVILFSPEKKDDAIANNGRGIVTEENKDTIMDTSKKNEQGMFECKMTSTWTFENGKAESPNAFVENVVNNENTFYFDVFLKDSNEKIYSSKNVPVGSKVHGLTLDKDLDAGTYEARVDYTFVDKDFKDLNTVSFMITIVVLK